MTALEYFTRDGSLIDDQYLAHFRFGAKLETVTDDRAIIHCVDTCRRCGGAGGSSGWPGYTCYDCLGDGRGRMQHLKVYSAAKNAKLDAAQAKRDAKRQAAFAAERAARQASVDAASKAFLKEHGPLIAALKNFSDSVKFSASLIESFTEFGSLTDTQVSAAQAFIAKEAARPAPAAAIEGRIEITGEIISSKVQYSDYGRTSKMLVLDDRGFKVWGTVPKDVPGECNDQDEWLATRGTRVTFTATISRSDNDSTFGFFKRPTKASVTGGAP
jgi:hypothetical protein